MLVHRELKTGKRNRFEDLDGGALETCRSIRLSWKSGPAAHPLIEDYNRYRKLTEALTQRRAVASGRR